MIYLIGGGYDVPKINKILMGTVNAELDADYVLEKIRHGINQYMDMQTMAGMLEDTMLSVTNGDGEMIRALMSLWINIVVKLHYYIITEDIMLPFTEIRLQYNDIRATTAMEG